MVQLKSFRYLEESGAANSSGSPPVIEMSQAEARNYSPAPSASSSGNQSMSTVTGGALTSNHSDERCTPATQEASSEVNSHEHDQSTLSSQEEYQTARISLNDEEEEEAEHVAEMRRQANDCANQPSTFNKQPVGLRTPQPAPRNTLANQRNQSSPQLSSMLEQQSPSASHLSQRTPKVGAKRFQKTTSADDLSQYSFGGSKLNSNQFEIRWRNLNLMAKKSKYSNLLRNNPICKMFTDAFGNQKGAEEPKEARRRSEDIFYSPPIHHKTFGLRPLSTGCVNATINEDSELGSPPAAQQDIDPYYNVATNENGEEFRPILNNLSGSVFSGQLTAILGPSGVGKTMLLNSLTGRNTLEGTGKVSLLGGENCNRMSVVTVPQADILPGKLTALEDLQFTSKLKNPQKGFNHQRNIERIVKHLQMEKFLNTRIDKLSGGEARRLSIGRELLNSPDIMILDEPTSGLDANTCKKIITALRDIVEHSDNILDRPMSIIVTIHQPQQEVLNLFHRVYVIALGGRAIYEGPPSCLLPTILEQSSLSRTCAADQLNENPAIVALEVASGEYGPQIINELAFHHENQTNEDYLYNQQSPFSTPRAMRSPPFSISPRFELLHRAQKNSSSSALDGRLTPVTNKRFAFGGAQPPSQNNDHMSSVTSLSYASTYDADLPEPNSKLKVDKRLRRSVVMKGDFVSHTLTLMKRCWLLTTRDMFLMSIRIIGFVLAAAGTVQIFAHALDKDENQCPTYETEVDDILAFMFATKNRLLNLQDTLRQASSTHLFMFHTILCLTMITSALSGLVFPLQMRMFMREYKNGWYSVGSFLTSHTLAELPVDIFGPVITLLITYPLCHQPESPYYWREAAYIVMMVLASLITKSHAQMVGAFLMDSIENSVFVSCVIVTPPALLSGVALRISSMYWPLQIFSYVSHLRYTFESLLVLRYGYGICPCDPEIIKGYPVRSSSDAIPPQLNNLASGLLDLVSQPQVNSTTNATLTLFAADSNNNLADSAAVAGINNNHENLFLRFLRLVTDASNLFVKDPQQLGSCSSYRSLYLMDMEIEDRIVPYWFGVLLMMFVLSRFLTYFVVKLVLRIRRNKRQD